MKIAIVDLWTDANKGDEALQGGLLRMLRGKHPHAEITGVFRFGLNEFEIAKPEIQKTYALLDRACGGLRRTHYAGHNAAKLKGMSHLLFSLYSFFELAVLLALYKTGARRLVPSEHKNVMDAISSADVVVWKGKNFRRYGGAAGINRQATLLVAGIISRVLNRRVFCVNASIWEMERGLERVMVKWVLSLCQSVSVRDSGSVRAAREMGLTNHFFAHDLSYYFLKSLAANISGAHRRSAIALTITKWGNEANRSHYVHALVEAVLGLVKEGVSDIYIVPQVVREAESNSALAKQFVSEVGTACAVHSVTGDMPIEELLSLYSRCSFLIGTRMHSCVFARFAGTPFLGIAYDDGPKWDILREFWPPEFIVNYGVGGDELRDKCLRAYREGSALINASATVFEKLPELSLVNVKDI